MRIVFLLALFQMIAPPVAVIADAWRLDQREPYAHVESESNTSCVVVHDHHCLLCSIATAPASAPSAETPVKPPRAVGVPAQSACARPTWRPLARAGAPRAPPAIEG